MWDYEHQERCMGDLETLKQCDTSNVLLNNHMVHSWTQAMGILHHPNLKYH
jgi:hypothetical protein